MQAIAFQVLKQGGSTLYRSVVDVVRDFLQGEALAGQDTILARYLKPDLLLIDDMGTKQLPKRSGECLFEIVVRRYETRSTMMTSNRSWATPPAQTPSSIAFSTAPKSSRSLAETTT